MRAALVAINVSNVMAESRYVSGIWRFNQGRAHIQYGLTFVKHRAFRNRENIARKTAIRQVVPELARGTCGKLRRPRRYAISSVVEAEVQQILNGAVQPGERVQNHDYRGSRRMVNSNVAISSLLARREVARGHGQLIQIGEKAVQATSSFRSSAPDMA